MYITSTKLQKGDLCAVSGYVGKLYPAIFYKDTGHSFQFINLNQYSVNALKKGEKPGKDYISGLNYQHRAVKINEDVLQPGDLTLYQEFKNL